MRTLALLFTITLIIGTNYKVRAQHEGPDCSFAKRIDSVVRSIERNGFKDIVTESNKFYTGNFKRVVGIQSYYLCYDTTGNLRKVYSMYVSHPTQGMVYPLHRMIAYYESGNLICARYDAATEKEYGTITYYYSDIAIRCWAVKGSSEAVGGFNDHEVDHIRALCSDRLKLKP